MILWILDHTSLPTYLLTYLLTYWLTDLLTYLPPYLFECLLSSCNFVGTTYHDHTMNELPQSSCPLAQAVAPDKGSSIGPHPKFWGHDVEELGWLPSHIWAVKENLRSGAGQSSHGMDE